MRPFPFGRLKDLPPIDWSQIETLGESALDYGDKALHYLIEKLPTAERVLWEIVDGIFGPKQFIKHILIGAALHLTLVSGRFFHRVLRRAVSAFSEHTARVSRLRLSMRNAGNYAEWKILAEELDKVERGDEWRKDPESRLYDFRVLRRSIDEMNQLISSGEVFNLMFRLRGSLNRAQFGMLQEVIRTQDHVKQRI